MTGRPEVLTIDAADIDTALVERAADVLRAGGLVAIPTETVYGLGCHALDESSIARVFEAKGRPASDPLIVHVASTEMLDGVIDGELSPVATALAEAFWPGPLTMVLPKADAVPAAISSGLDTVGVRWPAHPVAAAIIEAAGVPVAAPSANPFGRISPTEARHVVDDLGARVDVVVDGGHTERGLESTVVAIRDDGVVILRHGAITAEALATVTTVLAGDGTPASASPGHDERHYSPRTPAIAVAPGVLDRSLQAPDGRTIVVAGYEDREPALPSEVRFVSMGASADLAAVAHDLYDALRRLDALAADLIVVELTGADGLGRAIDDRLTRAASSVVAHSVDALAAALDDA